MEFVIFREGRVWRWALKDFAGKALAVSPEGYADLAQCKAVVTAVKSAFRAPVEVIDDARPPKGGAALKPVAQASPPAC